MRSDNASIIDIHAHVYVHEYAARAQASTSSNGGAARSALPGASDSIAHTSQRIELMDAAGVGMQVLSPPPVPYSTDPAEAAVRARLLNDGLADLVRRHPQRFAAFASLPLPHIDASLSELARVFDELHMVGITLLCFCGDSSIADPQFEPLFAEMNRRAAVLFLHPCVNGICSPFVTGWGLTAAAGPTFEDTTIALHLITRRIPARYPRIRIVIPHLGGSLPMLLERLDHQLPKAVPDLEEPPSATARRFWYDSVTHGSVAALQCALSAFGAERLLSGSDFPFLTQYEPYQRTIGYIRGANLAPEILERLEWRNAAALLASHSGNPSRPSNLFAEG